MKTTVRADAKLQNLPEEAQEELWELRHPEEEGGRVWTLTEIAAWVPGRFQFEVSKTTVGEFYQWLTLKKRCDAAAARALQAKIELAKDPDINSDDIERMGQTIFAAEALEIGDVRAYVALAKLKLAKSKQALESQKLEQAAKDKIEAGLDALFAEIKGNPKAEKLFSELKATVAKS
jgi:hypothetical protein